MTAVAERPTVAERQQAYRARLIAALEERSTDEYRDALACWEKHRRVDADLAMSLTVARHTDKLWELLTGLPVPLRLVEAVA